MLMLILKANKIGRNCVIMLKCHILLVTLEENAVLVPLKLSSELELRSTFLGQFGRHSDGIFSGVTLRTVAFKPKYVDK